MIEIPRPSKEEVIKYLNKWDSLENYVLQENALDKLFFKVYPINTEIDDILIKCSSLNDFYSTNIFSIFPVAKHILNLNIDKRLKQGDTTLVNDIANVTIANNFQINTFDRDVCDVILDKIIVGGYDENGNKIPYQVTIVFDIECSREINTDKDYFVIGEFNCKYQFYSFDIEDIRFRKKIKSRRIPC